MSAIVTIPWARVRLPPIPFSSFQFFSVATFLTSPQSLPDATDALPDLAELEAKVTEAPTNYDAHAALVDALRLHMEVLLVLIVVG